MQLWATSDLHVDHADNWAWLRQCSAGGRQDALIVAGDIAHRLDAVVDTLKHLRARFGQVFFIPGNHDLWVPQSSYDSVQKAARLVEICAELGVTTKPERCGGRWVVPLWSWYSEDFAAALDGLVLPPGWGDLRYCRWPAEAEPPARFFAGLNRSRLRDYGGEVVTFSHFAPRLDLLPPPEGLRFKALPLVAGSTLIEEQLRRLGAAVHVFGHTHIRCDRVIDKVRYVQNGLGYPRERRGRPYAFKRLD